MTEVRCPSGRNFSVFSTLLRGSHRLSHPRLLQYDTFGTQIDKFCQSPLVSIFTFHAAVRCRNSHSENARPGFFCVCFRLHFSDGLAACGVQARFLSGHAFKGCGKTWGWYQGTAFQRCRKFFEIRRP